MFAPVAAFTVMGLSVGRHAARALEFTLGQALGIVCADLVVSQIGSGAVQIGALVGLSMMVASLVGPGLLLAQQAAISAVVVAASQPPGSGLSSDRLLDVLIGAAVAIAMKLLLFPADPLALARMRGEPLLAALAGALDEIAHGLESMDRHVADHALALARSLDRVWARVAEAIEANGEVVALSPRRRRSRELVARQAVVTAQLDLAVRNTRVLARRARRSVERREHVPKELIDALRTLSEAVRDLDLGAGRPEHVARTELLVSAAGLANACLHPGRSLSVTVLIAQVRSLVQDLLLAAGLDEDTALQAIDAA